MEDEKKDTAIYKKLFEIQNQGLKFTKNAVGVHNAKYVTLDSMLEKLLPILEEQKLLMYHNTVCNEVVTTIIDIETDSFVYSAFLLKEDMEPQKVGGAISYAKRYNIGQLLNIVTDIDDDADSSSPENTKDKEFSL